VAAVPPLTMTPTARPAFLRARGPAPAAAAVQPVPVGLSSPRERGRRQVVALIMVVYLLAIFEGALRKYVAPQFSQYIYFIRDPVVVCAYLLATRHGLWPRGERLFTIGVAMGVVGALLVMVQMATGGTSDLRLLLGAYGWRSYFLYVPLAFLVAEQFTHDDLRRFARLTLILAIPMAVLAVAQFMSPLNAPINVGTAEEKELQFQGMNINGTRVRATGTFSSNAGLQQFIGTALAIAIAALLQPARRRLAPLPVVLLAIAALLTSVAFSGSRGTVMLSGLLALVAVSIGVVGHGSMRAKALTLPLCVAGGAVLLAPMLFPEAIQAFIDRWQHASEFEGARIEGGVWGRALMPLFDFIRLVGEVPFFGYGLGYGGNASILMRATIDGVVVGILAEVDFSRHMVDLGPLVGGAYIVFRLAVAVWAGRRVLAATRHAGDPLPMMLFGYAGFTIVLAQIAGHGSINVYGWLFIGLCVAAARAAMSQPKRVVASAPLVPSPVPPPVPVGLRTQRPRAARELLQPRVRRSC
jgi:hypothetical protein